MAIASRSISTGKDRAMSTPQDPEQLSSEARQELEQGKAEAERLVGGVTEAARERGRDAIESVKQKAADRADEVADAIDSTSDDLEPGDDGNVMSGYGHSIAALMRRMAGGLREGDIDDFAAELADYARRSPGAFLAGSVALGFGLSRFMKASGTRSRGGDYGDEDYALDFDDDYEPEMLDDDYEFDTRLEPSPPPEIQTRGPGEPWPADADRIGAERGNRHG
jgi:uncharacterized membrane protein